LIVGIQKCLPRKSDSRRKPSVKFWLLTLNENQVLRLAMLKTNLRRKKKRRNNSSRKPRQKKKTQAATCGRLPTWGLGTASRKEHKYCV
jgi:hypothetical protein